MGVMLRKDECKCKCCSQDLILFMNELLIFDKDKLLGVNGVDSVKCHKWFDVLLGKGCIIKQLYRLLSSMYLSIKVNVWFM